MKVALIALCVMIPCHSISADSSLVHRHHVDTTEAELKALALQESSGGKNLKHKRIDHGVQEGDRAGGYFGLMPKSVQLIIKIDPKLRKKYHKWLQASSEAITAELNHNRKMDREVAETMWRWLRAEKTLDQTACSWFWGPWSEKCGGTKVSTLHYVQSYHANYREVLYVDAKNP